MAEDKKNGVTNADLLRFYKNAPTDGKSCPCTAKYLERLKKDGKNLHGPYAGVIDTFKGKRPGRDSDDDNFYTWLGNLESSGALFGLNALKNLDPHFDVFLAHTNKYDVSTQKWHLYVSWYAYCEFYYRTDRKKDDKGHEVIKKWFTADKYVNGEADKDGGILQHTTCRELLLWMCEAAGSKNTEYFYDALLKIEKGQPNGISGWASKVRKEIIGQIPGSSGTESDFASEKEELS